MLLFSIHDCNESANDSGRRTLETETFERHGGDFKLEQQSDSFSTSEQQKLVLSAERRMILRSDSLVRTGDQVSVIAVTLLCLG